MYLMPYFILKMLTAVGKTDQNLEGICVVFVISLPVPSNYILTKHVTSLSCLKFFQHDT
jgi:hypothetical protein